MALITPSRATGKLFGPTGRVVKVGWVTDCHSDLLKATDTAQGGKFFADTVQKITAIAGVFNARNDISLVYENGDWIDGSASAGAAQTELTAVTNAWNAITKPKYHGLGNHDVWMLTKAQVRAITGQSANYYSFVSGGVTFIVFDGNYSADDDGASMEITSGGTPSPYVSYINPTQRAWLSATLAASPYPCVIFCHYPVYYVGASSWGLTNAAAVRNILETYYEKVIGCVSGHLHDNYIRRVNGILYATTHATVTGAYPKLNYAVLNIYPDARTMTIEAVGVDATHVPQGARDTSKPNLLTYPQSIDQWSATGATVAYNVATDPVTNTQIADRMLETSNTSQHSFNSVSMNFTLGTTYVFSCYVKYEAAQFIQLLFGSGAFGANAWANFDIQNGVLGTVGSAATARIASVGDDWYRISIAASATATAAAPVAIFGADVGTMTRAASYAGSTANTRLISSVQVEAFTQPNKWVRPAPRTFTGNTEGDIVGALRWDAWHHPTQDTVRTAVEASLGPSQYHWRLPFFATEPTADSCVIAGDQAAMDAEIDYAVEAGLDYWAFFWYGKNSTNGMRAGWDYFQTSSKKSYINWCFYYAGQAPLHDDVVNDLANVVERMQQNNYQLTKTGRPLVFVFDDGTSKSDLAADVAALRAAATGVGLLDPYIVFHQSTPSAAVLATYGFNATTTYAPVASASGSKPYNQLDTTTRAVWATQAAQAVDVVPSYHMGWDRRPRVEHPVPWETPSGTLNDYYYTEYPEDISTHIDAILAWVRANRARTPEGVVIGYAWNENDEGGWIVPTLSPSGVVNTDRVYALRSVLVGA